MLTKDANSNGSCLVCGKNTVEEFLDLGRTALANKFLTQDELKTEEPTYPLKVGFCRTCAHVQLTECVPPHEMFEDYLYSSSASDTLKAHLCGLADLLVSKYSLGSTHLVMDIGCNDGTLLRAFQGHGVKTLGVDPAVNLAELNRDSGIERYVGFFNSRSAKQIVEKWGKASIITATNTFPHIPELADFLAGIKTVLANGGVFVIEAHYLLDMLEQGAFDTIYHEHVSYWALKPMAYLFAQHEMEIVRVERLPIHHGQVRVFVQRKGEGRSDGTLEALTGKEEALGLDQLQTFLRFADQTSRIKSDLHRTLSDLRRNGKSVAGYGAPAKGNTLLSYLELGPDMIDYIADRSPLKQGRCTPGMHIPVVEPARLLADQPDYVLLLAWNFMDEVMAQQAEYRSRGGKFIIPVPKVRIL
jgi:hypothetical protein